MNEDFYKLKGIEWVPIVGIKPYINRVNEYLLKNHKNEDVKKVNNNIRFAAVYQSSIGVLTGIILAGALTLGLEHLLK